MAKPDENFITICLNCIQAGTNGAVNYNHVIVSQGILIQYHCFSCGMNENKILNYKDDAPPKTRESFIEQTGGKIVKLKKAS